ncbi:MAG: glycosyltransferase family 4 protein [Euryarchaeota archaeon]|nr:glycosyltransferase family 4 protein [Euryarchaeota archaeon]MBU4032153.1 glycosyltransferase family 4 protein [Candidatus Thermoplasmatota archaeon]MBU4071167.1 glycosyltransferase family 4 protein [Candidatus Thermoplasmatota archaeon]MBU4143863.1 glycosyltransferase family 4 protein [Candidatus Thermoplasmatota archaeon]
METLKFIMTSTFYPSYHIGGDAVHVKYLAEELVKRGHEVHVMFSRDAYRMKRKGVPESIDHGKVQVHALESTYGRLTPMKVYAFGNSGFILNNYRKLVSDVKPDVVHHHNISLLGHGLLRKLGDYRQLYTAHDHWLVCQGNDMIKKGEPCDGKGCLVCALASGRPPQFWRRKLDTTGIDCLICPSEYMASKLAPLGIKTTILPNFSSDPPASIPDIDEEDFYLYMGVMGEHKGVRVLLDAFSKSSNRLILLGRGALAKETEAIIEKRGLAPRMRYLGWKTDEKWPYLKKANAVLIPSICQENNPLVALEAMSVGTPVICSDAGGTKEVVKLLSEKLVIPMKELEIGLASISRPTISRAEVMAIFKTNFSVEAYMKRYMEIVKGGCQSI